MELNDKNLTFWTLTLWSIEADMKAFRNTIPLRKVVQQLPIGYDKESYVHWTQEEHILKDRKIFYEKMICCKS